MYIYICIYIYILSLFSIYIHIYIYIAKYTKNISIKIYFERTIDTLIENLWKAKVIIVLIHN